MSNICRLCLGSGRLVPIFSTNECVPISCKIMSCTTIKIEVDDELPSCICPKCLKRLDNSYKFKLQCEESDKKLRNDYENTLSELLNNTHEDLCLNVEEEENSEFTSIKREVMSQSEYESEKVLTKTSVENEIVKEVEEANVLIKTRSGNRIKEGSSKKITKSKEKTSGPRGRKKLLDESLLYVDDDVLENKILAAKMLEDIKKRELKAQKRRERREREKALKPSTEKVKKETSANQTLPKGKTKAEMLKEEKEKRLLQRKNKIKLNSVNYCANNQCYTCGKIVSSRFRLKMHMRTHTGERPYSCPYCSKTFALAQNLKVHERTHTGEKPLLCVICGKTFAQSAGLVAHTRLHTGETPYRCDICPSSFRTPGHLQYHIRQHTGEKNFECSICNRAFITKGDLTQHHRTHTGERPFVCSVCGLRMSRSSHLSRHMLTHTGEKPHKCHICGTAYAQKSDMARHIKKHSTQSQNFASCNRLMPISNANSLPNGQITAESQQTHSDTHENANVMVPSSQSVQVSVVPMDNINNTNTTVLSIEQNRLINSVTLPIAVHESENTEHYQTSVLQTGIDRLLDSRNVLDNRTQMTQLDARTLGLGLGLGLLHTHHL